MDRCFAVRCPLSAIRRSWLPAPSSQLSTFKGNSLTTYTSFSNTCVPLPADPASTHHKTKYIPTTI